MIYWLFLVSAVAIFLEEVGEARVRRKRDR